ncbi:MAG: metallophosphoesterase, partial [Bdellovibrionales bacterium]|nr:metallophosphoesterase [Oligoflexia bacterium]
MKVFSKFGLFTALTVVANLVLSACEVTPYGADVAPDYCKSLSIRTNIQKLKSLEQANPSKQNFKVAIISDSHVNLDSLARAVERINRRSDIDFVMILGDLTDQGLESQYQFTCKNLSKFEKPFISVIGNHDSLSNGKLLWTQYFGDASKGFDGYNYSFSYLGTKFIAYNDNGFEFQNVPDQSFIQREAAISAGEVR